jgi:integrase
MLTLKQAFEIYLEKSSFAESSIEVKQRAFNLFTAMVGDLPIEEVTYGQAEDYKLELAKGRARKAANIYMANLKPFFVWLVRRGYLETNPFDELTLYPVSERNKEIFTPAEIERILRIADLRMQVITLLGLCSLRRAEVLNLTTADLNFAKGYLYIRPKADTATTWRWDIKNHQEAIVPLPEKFSLMDMTVNLHALIRQLSLEIPVFQPYLCIKPACYRYLIQLKDAGRLKWVLRNCPWQNFPRDWRHLLKRASVRSLRFQDLRVTFATTMVKNGLAITDTSKLMRHSSIQTTATYYVQVEEQKLFKRVSEIADKFYVNQK